MAAVGQGQEAHAGPTQPSGVGPALSLIDIDISGICRDQRPQSVGSGDQGCAQWTGQEDKPLPLLRPQGASSFQVRDSD